MAVIEAEMQVVEQVEQQAAFDYAQIDEAVRDEVQAAARSIHQLSKGVVTGIIAIGQRLIEVKGVLPHGQFIEWVLGEFSVTERTAQNYMNVAREYGNPQKRNTISLFSPTVAYLLAAPSTPDEARAEVEQAAVRGEKVTVEFAREAVRKAKPEPVRYAPVWELEAKVETWAAAYVAHRGGDMDTLLDALRASTRDAAHGLSGQLEGWLDEQSVTFRKSDLTQAINNVRERRRVAQRQATARAVYVEPERKPWGKNPYSPGAPYDEQGWMIHVLSSGEYQAINERTGETTDPFPIPQRVYEVLRLLVSESPSDEAASPTMPDTLSQEGYGLLPLSNGLWRWEQAYFISEPFHSAAEAVKDAYRDFERQQSCDESARFPTKAEFAELEAAVEATIDPVTAEKMRASAEASRRVREDLELPDTPTASHTLPDDLTAAGYRLTQPKPNAWAIISDEGDFGPAFESNWHIEADIDLAIEEARAFLGENAYAACEAWLAEGPREPSLRECLAILEYAKRIVGRVRGLEPSLDALAGAILPPWSQLVNAVERKVKRG